MLYSEVKTCLKEISKDTLKNLIEQFGENVVREYQENGYKLSSMEEAYKGKYRDYEEFVMDITMNYFEIDGHYFKIYNI